MNALFSTLTVADEKRIAAVLLIILGNFAFAVIGAFVKGGFDPAAGGFDVKKLPEFFGKQVLPYVVGLAFFEAFLHVLAPSDLASALFSNPASVVASPDGTVAVTNTFAWLDPTALWTVYGAMVSSLVVQLSQNLFYLFGKGLTKAQSISAQ